MLVIPKNHSTYDLLFAQDPPFPSDTNTLFKMKIGVQSYEMQELKTAVARRVYSKRYNRNSAVHWILYA